MSLLSISRLARIAAVALILSSATMTIAQKTGTRLDRNRGSVGAVSNLKVDTAIRSANQFSQCVAQREGKGMRKALDLPFASAEQSKAMSRIRDRFDDCLGVSDEFDELRASAVLMAGGSAEWFVRVELDRVDLTPLAGMTDEALDKTAYKPRNALEDLGLCILRRSPERARALINANITTAAEITAFKAVSPDIGPCVDQGNMLTLNRANLRAVIAYAIYRAASLQGAAVA